MRCSQEGYHSCYPQSQVAYAYHALSLLCQRFVWPNMTTEMGVVTYMYLKHSPDRVDFKYMGSWVLIPYVRVLLLKYYWYF